MITYNEFKNFYNILDEGKEIEIFFKNNKSCLIVKHNNYLSYGSNTIKKFNSLDDSPLKQLWNIVNDITIDFTFSLIYDKEDILKVYNYKI